MSDIEEAYQIISEFTLSEVCFYEGAWGGPDALRFSRRFSSQLLSAVNSNNMDVIRETVGSLRGFVSEFFTEYDTKVDADLFLSGIELQVIFDEFLADALLSWTEEHKNGKIGAAGILFSNNLIQ